MSSRRVPRWIPIAGSALLLLALFSWSEGLFHDRVGPEDRRDAGAPAWTGPTTVAAARDVARVVEVTGTVEPLASAAIAARVLGTVDEVLVREGDRVAAGDVLVRLGAPELQARKASARGASEAAAAALEQARRDSARMEALAAREAATRVELERARTAVAVAEAELARARQAESAEAAVASHVVLRAPFAGLVVERLADPGDLAAPGGALLRLADDSAFRLEAAVDERDAAGLVVGATAEALVDAIGLRTPAALVEILPALDPRSRTRLVKAGLPAAPGLAPGQFGRLLVPAGARRAVVVEAAAVHRAGGLTSVRRVGDDGRARMRPVRLGAEVAPGQIEVLSGVEPGDRLAVTGTP